MTVKEFYEYMKFIGGENYKMVISYYGQEENVEENTVEIWKPEEIDDNVGRVKL